MFTFEDSISRLYDPLAYRMTIINKNGKKLQDFNIVDEPFMKKCGYTEREIEEFRDSLKKDTKIETI